MARYQAILAYDGTPFLGFQRQAAGRTVQGEMESALRRIGWEGRAITGAGRTDTGVHASGQVVAFDLDWPHGPEALRSALNAALPAEIAVRRVEAAAPDFHPRYDAVSRQYVYRLLFDPARDPLLERQAWRLWPAPNLGMMAEAAALVVGEHDFSGFGTAPKPGGSTVRTVLAARWEPQPGGAAFSIEANAFLFRMVRRIVKAHVDLGAGRMATDAYRHYLSGSAPDMVQGLAPARGLTLTEVRYGDDGV